MNDSDQALSASFHESLQLLLQLHHEMSTGHPDGPRADEIRDAMERPWYQMSHKEQELFRGLSADLYTIGQTWEPGPTDEGMKVQREAMELLHQARAQDLLAVLRHNEHLLPAESVAFLRGLAWSLLGEYEVAVRFLQEAIRLTGRDWPPYFHVYVKALIAAGQTEKALAELQEIASRCNDPLVLLDTAETYFVRSTEVDDLQAKSLLKKATEIAEQGIRLASQAQPTESLTSQCANVQLWIALYNAQLGNVQAANSAISIAREFSPRDPALLFVEEFVRQMQGHRTWDMGLGKGLTKFRGPIVDAASVPLSLLATN